MIVKDVYQSGINILIDGFKALIEESGGVDSIPNYGAKSNTMFDHCKISFLVTDVRGVEIITLKSLASKVDVLTKNPFVSPKKLRPTIFSNEYPSVNTTDEYKKFTEATSQVVQKNMSLMDGLSEEIRNTPAIYKYNFAGSVSFDVLVTFAGSNLTQLLGVFPGQGLRNKDNTWIDPYGQYFINKAVASFKKIYYDALEGIFGTVDMETDVALEKLYFTKLRNRDMSTLDAKANVLTNVLYAQVIHPFGSIDLISNDRPATKEDQDAYKEAVRQRMDYANSVVSTDPEYNIIEDRPRYMVENSTFILYTKCSIQTLLMLHAYTDIVTYYTDMKNVMGVSDMPSPAITAADGGIKIDGNLYPMDNAEAAAILTSKNQTVIDLAKDIEAEKASVLGILRKYQQERDFYEENRYKNAKLRPPKSMIQRKEYYNMVPLYAQTCCVLKFTEKDILKLENRQVPTNMEFEAIKKAMRRFYNIAKVYFSYY